MKVINHKIKKDGGYAILFAVVVVGIISMITIGLSNAAYKQMVLSSVARDSTTAFYQADIASECALYADYDDKLLDNNKSQGTEYSVTCADNILKYYHSDSTTTDGITTSIYKLEPQNETDNKKCFRINVTKTESTIGIATKVQAFGYNICKKANARTVERAIEVNY